MIRVILKPEKEKPLRAFHPWVFSGAIDRLDDGFKSGSMVRVLSSREEFLGIGYLNPRSQIAVRMLTFKDELIDQTFFEQRLLDAKHLRDRFLSPEINACRLVHSEGDFLPGLILDRYGDYLVVQFLTVGMEVLKPIILDAIKVVFPAKGVYEHSNESMRRLESGSGRHSSEKEPDDTEKPILAKLYGEDVPEYIEIEEYSHRFLVDLKHGQKTGFFLDQRENRKMVSDYAKGKKILNCFAYTGGFSIYAAKAGAASVMSVEIQERALNMMKSNFELNGLTGESYRFACEDVFQFLRKDPELYDCIILDPPAFCKNAAQINQAARGYKDINLFAMKRLVSGGLLFTCSCSSYITPDLFQKIRLI